MNRKPNEIQNQSIESSVEKVTNVYEVEEILDVKTIKKTKHCLVRWKGFDEEHNSWEPRKNLQCTELLKMYERRKHNKIIAV